MYRNPRIRKRGGKVVRLEAKGFIDDVAIDPAARQFAAHYYTKPANLRFDVPDAMPAAVAAANDFQAAFPQVPRHVNPPAVRAANARKRKARVVDELLHRGDIFYKPPYPYSVLSEYQQVRDPNGGLHNVPANLFMPLGAAAPAGVYAHPGPPPLAGAGLMRGGCPWCGQHHASGGCCRGGACPSAFTPEMCVKRESCIRKVKKRQYGNATHPYNVYAVCTASIGRKKRPRL
jgi:hypothetical protein